MHHSLQFLIDLIFNLSLVEEYAIFDMKRVEGMLKFVLSADLFPRLSFMSLQPGCVSGTEAGETSPGAKRPSCVRRGRDAPFPAPVRRRRSGSSVSGSTLLHSRYSKPTPRVVVTPPPRDESESEDEEPILRGRSLQRDTRSVRDSNPYPDTPISPFLSRTESLLSVPYRTHPRPTVQESETGHHNRTTHSLDVPGARKDRRPSRRYSSIPPPLNLPPGYVQRMDEDSDYETGFSATDILPEPELLQARKQSLRRQRSCRPAPLLSGGYF